MILAPEARMVTPTFVPPVPAGPVEFSMKSGGEARTIGMMIVPDRVPDIEKMDRSSNSGWPSVASHECEPDFPS